MNIDLYAFEKFAHVYFDVSFDMDKSIAELILNNNNWIEPAFFKSDIMINDQSINFAGLLTEHLVPYYNLQYEMEVEQSLEDDISALNNNIETMLQKTAFKPYCANGMMGGMSVGPHGHHMIIEDFNNELDTHNDPWENIMPDDNIIYLNNLNSVFVCKNKEYYEDLYKHNLSCQVRPTLWKHIRLTCAMFLNSITNKGTDIKKNIVDDNRNPYYWKELKKTIEVMDLNFLEFHRDVINMTKIDLNHVDLTTTIKYKKECEDYLMKVIHNVHSDLDEIKYAISNLSTPSHTHDEAILQKETEKVNDRILMLSFIAMAVSAIGMMRSEDIDVAFKVFSGIGIFSLPLVYYMVRDVQKRISLRKNEQNEWKRRLTDSIKDLEQVKKERDNIKDEENIPDNFKKDLTKFMDQFVVAQEKTIKKLKKKVK